MKIPDLDPEDVSRIRGWAREWAELHPSPEVPVLVMLDGSELTPKGIADALDRPTSPHGRTLYRMFSVALHGLATEPISIDQVVGHFGADIARWRAQASG